MLYKNMGILLNWIDVKFFFNEISINNFAVTPIDVASVEKLKAQKIKRLFAI